MSYYNPNDWEERGESFVAAALLCAIGAIMTTACLVFADGEQWMLSISAAVLASVAWVNCGMSLARFSHQHEDDGDI